MIKRLFEWLVVLVSAVFWLPLFALTALLVRWFHGRPVLFTQDRTGLNGRVFKLYKFRSMTNTRDEAGKLLPDEERMTDFGRFIRSTSLDELPSILNFLKGDIALVGPRPLLPEYLDHYTPEQARRHETPPGITGWAQVNGRNSVSWEQKFTLDVWYVDNRSLWLDLRILALTALKVVKREGIAEEGSVTMSRFDGSDR